MVSLLLAALLAATLLVAGPAGSASPKSAADLDQWANSDNKWQNGDLNASNSSYREGESVPFRAYLTGLSTSGSHTLTIQYDTIDSGKHAYDYVTSYDRTASPDPCGSGGAAGGSAISPCAGGSGASVPSDPGLSVPQVAGSFTIKNGSISGVSYGGSDPSGKRSLTITFTAASANVVIAWGGHIASQADWGVGNAASSISGAPYHMRIIDLDGQGGNQDRSMQSSAILVLSPPSITTQVSTAGFLRGTKDITDTATLSGDNGPVTGSVLFFLCGPAPSAPDCSSGGVDVGSTQPIVDGKATSDPISPRGGGIYCFRAEYVPDANAKYGPAVHTNQSTECFSVFLPPGTLEVVKSLQSGSGTFNLYIKNGETTVGSATNVGNGGTTGVKSLTAGTYQVGETAFAGTNLSDYTSSIECRGDNGSGSVVASGTGPGPLDVAVADGDETKCVVTNTLKPNPHVTVHKVCPGGKAAETDRFQITNKDQATDVVLDCAEQAQIELAPNASFDIGEVGAGTPAADLDNYATAFTGDCSGTLARGETASCWIVNVLKPNPHVTVHKVCPHGKAAPSDRFAITNGNHPTDIVLDCGEQADLELQPGADYSLGEVGAGDPPANLDDYFTKLSAGCSGTLARGETADCTITNTLKPGTLEVIKRIVPSSDPGKFNLLIDGSVKKSNAGNGGTTGAVSVDAGDHTVAETAGTGTSLGNYDSTISCSVGGHVIATVAAGTGPLTVHVGPGQAVVCTVTNTRHPTPPPPPPPAPTTGTIEVVKSLLPSSDGGKFDLQIDGTTKKAGVGNGGTTGQVEVTAGSHSVGEVAAVGTSGSEYTSSIECKQDTTVLASGSGTGPLNVNVTVGAHVVCTITNVRKAIDLVITKRANPTTGHVGDAFTYTIVVTNKGPGTATGVTMTDPVPAQLEFVSVSTTQGACTGGTVVSCNLGTLGPGASATITVVTKAKAAGTAVNTAVTVASEPESNTGDNSASATVKIEGQVFLPPACYTMSVTPHQLTVGKRTTIVAKLRTRNKPVAGVTVFVRGPGISKSAKTDKHGVARITVSPTKAGILRIQVPSHATCTRPRLGVAGVFTPPVTG